MIKVKEFASEISIEKIMNSWLKKNNNIKIIDIKYSADQFSSNVLLIYEEG